MKIGMSTGVNVSRGRRLAQIITTTIPPVLGPIKDGDTVQAAYTAGTYASSEGTISSSVETVTINGTTRAMSDTVPFAGVVWVTVLVTDSVGNTRVFSAGVQTVAASAPKQMVVPGLAGGVKAGTLTLGPEPESGGNTITSYSYEIDVATGDFTNPVVQGTQAPAELETAINISPLTAGDYKARQRATNAVGAGGWSLPTDPVTVQAAVADDTTPQLRSTLTQGSVTYTLNKAVLTRQTIDGCWVLEQDGTVEITAITPEPVGTGASFRNGLSVNNLWEGDNNHVGDPWDGRGIRFNATLERSPAVGAPLVLAAGEVALKCVSKDPLTTPGDADRVGYAEESSAIYAVADISLLPAAKILSPCPMWWTGRAGFIWNTADPAAAVTALGELDVSTHSTNTYATVAGWVNKFQGMATYSTSASGDGYQAWLMHGSASGTNFGQFVLTAQSKALLGIMGNAWTSEQKQNLLVSLASMGNHLLQLGSGATGYYGKMPQGLGGHMQWQQAGVDCAELISADIAPANIYETVLSNMVLQPFEFTQAFLDRLAVHTNSTDPMDSRERPVNSINTTENTVNLNLDLGGERYRWEPDDVKEMVSTDGLVSSLVRSGGWLLTLSSVNIPVEDASGFAGKTVYFRSVVPYKLGEVAWTISDYRKYLSRFDIAVNSEYVLGNNKWSALALFWLRSGLIDTQRTPALRWVEQRALGYRKHQSNPFNSTWENEFWDQHSAALLTASSVGAGIFSNISFPFVKDDWYGVAGVNSATIDINILTLPYDNESAITGVEYQVDGGSWAALTGYAGVGKYTITVAAATTDYEINLRAVNAEGPSAAPAPPQVITSGPLTIAANFPVPESTVTTDAGLSTSHSVALPSNLALGDLIVIEALVIASQNLSILGYTRLETDSDNHFVFYKSAEEAEPASVSITLSTSSRGAYVARRITNWSGLKAIDGLDANFDTKRLVDRDGQNKNLWVSSASAETSDWSVSDAPTGFTGLVSRNAGGTSSALSRGKIMSAYKTEQTEEVDPGPFTTTFVEGRLLWGITYVVTPGA